MASNDEFLYNLRNANPIETTIGAYVNVIRRGKNYVCSCPFHSEKTPSCTIFTETQSFYCFGCGAGGDVITFIMKVENLDFSEAVKLLAQRSGLEVPERNSADSSLAMRKTRIYEMNRIAANFFYNNLVKGADKSGLKYFVDRKLSPQTIKKFGLGYASDSWNALYNELRSKGYSDDEIIDAWLGGRSKHSNGVYDIFRKRVMFPIVDLRGNIIGFGGRVLDNSVPKYLNTGATPVFDKGSNLFSMNFAKLVDTKRLILCEGYMDVIAVNQAGFDNVVATLGTAITPNQARLISHYADEIIIAYDSDSAGQKATQKAINHFADVGVKTKIIHMDGAKDPDEFIKKYGVNRFRMLLDESNDATDFMLDKCEDGIDISTELGKVEFLKRSANVLAGIESPLEREVYISRTAKKCDISVQVLKSHIDDILRKNKYSQKKNEWRSIKASATYQKPVDTTSHSISKRITNAEELIIYYLLKRPLESDDVEKIAPHDIFVSDFNKRVYLNILESIKASDNFSLSSLNEKFTTEEMGKISGFFAKNSEIPLNFSAIIDCAETLRNYTPHNDDMSIESLQNLFNSKKNK